MATTDQLAKAEGFKYAAKKKAPATPARQDTKKKDSNANTGPVVDTTTSVIGDGSSTTVSDAQLQAALESNSTKNPIVQPGTTATTDTDVQTDVDISGKPYRFNPPLHNINLPKRVDFADSTTKAVAAAMKAYLIEQGEPNINTRAFAEFGALRLGRIMQGDTANGYAAQGKNRWGFRFLYNPPAWSVTSSRNDSVVLDPRSVGNLVLSGLQNNNFQSHNFTLLLNRIPDVIAGNQLRASDYNPTLSPEDMKGIKQYGTGWDLEYLYRVANGVVKTRNNGMSGNIGLLTPSPAYLVMGKSIRHFGFTWQVSYTHKMFSSNMVPILTEVTIAFTRIVDIVQSKSSEFYQSLGSIYIDPSQTAATDTGTNDDGSVTPGGPITDPGGGGSDVSISVDQVAHNAQTMKATSSGQCLATVKRVLEQPGWNKATAADFARATNSNGHMKSGYDAPLGAVYMWTGGSSGAGHITVSSGGGSCWTTDWHGALSLTKVGAKQLTDSWHLNYAGWSEWYGPNKLNTSTSVA